MNKTQSSDSGIFLWLTYQTLEKMGLDTHAIFSGINLPNQLPDKQIRRDNSTQQRFWQHAQNITQNADIGLHVGVNMPFIHGDIMEYLFLSSPTFGDGLNRFLRYQKLLTTALNTNYTIENNIVKLYGLQHPTRHYLECAIGFLLNALKHLTQQQFQPLEIGLTYTDGASPETYQKLWHCPVYLHQQEGYVLFDAKILDLPSLSAEPQILKIHEHLAEQKLKNLDKYDLIYQIERLLSQGLLEYGGTITIHTIAQHLNVHPRTLRADLTAIHSSFDTILTQYREKTARKLLAQPHISIDQIVYLLGFSEPSAFSRAFKRWTGETPSAYRTRKFTVPKN